MSLISDLFLMSLAYDCCYDETCWFEMKREQKDELWTHQDSLLIENDESRLFDIKYSYVKQKKSCFNAENNLYLFYIKKIKKKGEKGNREDTMGK